MRNTFRATVSVLAMTPAIAAAQTPQPIYLPMPLPAQTVIGNANGAAGPAVALPISQLLSFSLPTPTNATLGGVFSSSCASHNWFNSLSTSGAFVCSQPSIADISGGAGSITGIAAITGSGTTYSSSQNAELVSRSNSGSPMVDTLPGSSPGVLPAGTYFQIKNADTSAVLAINVGSGATLKAKLATTGYVYLCPGQAMGFYSDGSNYWGLSQPIQCSLGAATTFYATPSGGSSTNNGLSASSPLDSITHAYQLAQGAFNANGQTVTIQSAAGTYSSAQQLIGPISGQGNTFAQGSIFPVVIQGDAVTPDNVIISVSGNSFGAMQVLGGADVMIQGFKLTASSAGNDVYSEGSKAVLKNMDYGAAFSVQIASSRESHVQLMPPYTISGGAGCHILESGGWISYETTGTVTLTGTPNFSTAFACPQYPGEIVNDFTPAFVGSATGLKCSASLNGITNGSSTWPGSGTTTSTGGQCG